MFITKGFVITLPSTTEKVNSCVDEKCKGFNGLSVREAKFCQYCGGAMAMRDKVTKLRGYEIDKFLANPPIKMARYEIGYYENARTVVFINETPIRKPDDPGEWQECSELPPTIADNALLDVLREWLTEKGCNPTPIDLLVKNNANGNRY